ncbi:YafY family protein [Microbacterium sediminicola]|uniref:YafY family protein n=1 Tax=Microbacterium sediminicola TaxID=415210 RepID=A0ABN2HUM6_9MICO
MSKPTLTSASDRAAILLQLVPYLVGQAEVSVAEAAAEFGVSADQMRAMVESLTVMGLPGGMHNDLYDIDWDLLESEDVISLTSSVGLERAPRLTAREAAALLAGLQVAAAIPGVAESEVYAGLLAKLARGAASAPLEVSIAAGPIDDARRAVAAALGAGVAVSFTYKAPDAAATTRTVDPATVMMTNGQWYLQGWCHLRQAMRTFHLERVSGVALTDIPITHARETSPAWFDDASGTLIAVLRFPTSVAPLLGDYLERAQVREIDANTSEAHMPIGDELSLRRPVVRRGGQVELVAPVSARAAARAWAEAGLAQYAADTTHP